MDKSGSSGLLKIISRPFGGLYRPFCLGIRSCKKHSWLGIVGFYEGAESLPGENLFHLGQELLPPRGLFVLLEGHGVGRALLALHIRLRSAPQKNGVVEQMAGN